MAIICSEALPASLFLFALSWIWAGPALWFGVAAGGLGFFQLASRSARKPAFGFAIGCALLAAWPVTPLIQTIYSPYQVIEKAVQPNGLMALLVSGSYYQKVYDLRLAGGQTSGALTRIIGYYELPFKTAQSLGHVAIVGAGSGNDVASALRNQAGQVDAVEIDPAIRDLGIENHPEHPYNDPRSIRSSTMRAIFSAPPRPLMTRSSMACWIPILSYPMARICGWIPPFTRGKDGGRVRPSEDRRADERILCAAQPADGRESVSNPQIAAGSRTAGSGSDGIRQPCDDHLPGEQGGHGAFAAGIHEKPPSDRCDKQLQQPVGEGARFADRRLALLTISKSACIRRPI